MAWSASKIFTAFLKDALDNTTAIDLGSDVPKVALYDNDITPDQTVTSANTAFNAGQWATSGNEVIDATGWPTGGRPLVSATWGASSNVVTYDAADTASVNSTTTLSATFGCLVYDDTLAAVVVDQGICYNYFGGSQSVTSGLFTIVWHASGIMAYTL
jgi:hypothetical protein